MRHGEPVGGRKYRGQLDDPLSENGWQQMCAAVGEFAGWERIYTSPLQRCAAFAESLSTKLRIPVVVDPRLQEGGFGAWEGKLPSEICAEDESRIFNFKCDPIGYAPENAEPIVEVHERVGAVWRDLLAAQSEAHVLVITHAGVIRMMLAHALGLPKENAYRIQVGNASLTRIKVERNGSNLLPTLVFHDGRL